MSPDRSRLGSAAVELVRRNPVTWHAARRGRAAILDALPRRRFAEVSGRFHRGDDMFASYGAASADTARRYVESGRETIGLIIDRLRSGGIEPLEADCWLEVGSGYGRLLRALVERVPPTRVWGVELDARARAFCEREFGVHTVASTPRFATANHPRANAIYSVSVLTHIDHNGSRAFLDYLASATQPGAVVLFTSQGPASLEQLERYDGGRFAAHRPELWASISSTGVGFVAYGYGDRALGMTWHDPAWIEDTIRAHHPSLRKVAYEPAGLDGHQDIWVYRDGAPSGSRAGT